MHSAEIQSGLDSSARMTVTLAFLYLLMDVACHALHVFERIDHAVGAAGGLAMFVGEGLFAVAGIAMMWMLRRVSKRQHSGPSRLGITTLTVVTGIFAFLNAGWFLLLLLMLTGIARD